MEDEKNSVNLLSLLWHWSDGVNSDPEDGVRSRQSTGWDRLGQVGGCFKIRRFTRTQQVTFDTRDDKTLRHDLRLFLKYSASFQSPDFPPS